MLKSNVLKIGVVALMSLLTLPGCPEDEETPTVKNGVYCTDQQDAGKTLCEVYGSLSKDTTFESDKVYLLKTGVFVGVEDASGEVTSTATLTVQAGTTIKGSTDTVTFLAVRRGSKLNAVGTKEAPILFTSAAPTGSRARGDWGGVIINGRAPINLSGGDAKCPASGEGGTGCYGGTDAADNSGELKYVKIEFGGYQITSDNELNGLALQGVGSGTKIDYVHLHMNKDDGIEFFGGTVNVRHLLVTGSGDDSIDWTYGWIGKIQYAAVQQYSDDSDNGIEADNNGKDNTATPRSLPTISNLTLVGSKDASSSDLGILLREGTGAKLWNVTVSNFNEGCLSIDQDETFNGLGTALVIKHSNVFCSTGVNYCDVRKVGDGQSCTTDGLDMSAVESFFTGEPTNLSVDPKLTDPTNETVPNLMPVSDSPLLGAGAAPEDSWFEATNFIGAFGTTDWTAGWTSYAKN